MHETSVVEVSAMKKASESFETMGFLRDDLSHQCAIRSLRTHQASADSAEKS
jgi:hypothetical protein